MPLRFRTVNLTLTAAHALLLAEDLCVLRRFSTSAVKAAEATMQAKAPHYPSHLRHALLGSRSSSPTVLAVRYEERRDAEYP